MCLVIVLTIRPLDFVIFVQVESWLCITWGQVITSVYSLQIIYIKHKYYGSLAVSYILYKVDDLALQ